MALDLYMLGLVVKDMALSLEFYRRLGLAVPDGAEKLSHVQIPMGNGLTFFLDSNPQRWDPTFTRAGTEPEPGASYTSVLEFYLHSQAAVDDKYAELTGYGYRGHAAPYRTPFGMYFALIKDPDNNTILLSGDLEGPPPA